MENARLLSECRRQCERLKKEQSVQKKQLLSLLNQSFPGLNRLFPSPARADGREKWVDFAARFWHSQCVCGLPRKEFVERYRTWCQQEGYHFRWKKALEIYAAAKACTHLPPKTEAAERAVRCAVEAVREGAMELAPLLRELQSLERTQASGSRQVSAPKDGASGGPPLPSSGFAVPPPLGDAWEVEQYLRIYCGVEQEYCRELDDLWNSSAE